LQSFQIRRCVSSRRLSSTFSYRGISAPSRVHIVWRGIILSRRDD
jgi:hypothetical protein